MDFVNKFTGGGNKAEGSTGQSTEQTTSSSSGGGFMDKINSAAGGGKESEKNEDYLDKGEEQSLANPSDLLTDFDPQESTLFKKSSSVRAPRTMSPPSSRPRTSRFVDKMKLDH